MCSQKWYLVCCVELSVNKCVLPTMLRVSRQITAATLLKKKKKKTSRMSLYLTRCASSSGPASSSSPVFPRTSCRCSPADWHTGFTCTSSTNPARDTRARTQWQLSSRGSLVLPPIRRVTHSQLWETAARREMDDWLNSCVLVLRAVCVPSPEGDVNR